MSPSQANSVTIYARVSGELPSRLPGRPPEQFDNDFLTFSCDQLEDRRWICPTIFLTSLVGLVTRATISFSRSSRGRRRRRAGSS